MTATTENTKAIPAIPEVVKEEKRYFILHYRYGNIPGLSKVFELKGNLRDAIQRGREHCVKMAYQFLTVRPFVFDLDEEEKRKSENPDYIEDVVRIGRR